MNVSVKIKNLPEIRRALRKYPTIMRKELTDALNKSAIYIGSVATQEITTGKNRALDTGRLRASILGGSFRGGSFSTNAGVTKATGSKLVAEVGTDVEYAIFIHEGTRYMRPRPFLLDAVNKADRQVQRFFTDSVQNALNKVGRLTR